MPGGQAAAAAKGVRVLFDTCSTPMRTDEDKDVRQAQDVMGDFVELVTAVKVGFLTLDPIGAAVIVGEKLVKYTGGESK